MSVNRAVPVPGHRPVLWRKVADPCAALREALGRLVDQAVVACCARGFELVDVARSGLGVLAIRRYDVTSDSRCRSNSCASAAATAVSTRRIGAPSDTGVKPQPTKVSTSRAIQPDRK